MTTPLNVRMPPALLHIDTRTNVCARYVGKGDPTHVFQVEEALTPAKVELLRATPDAVKLVSEHAVPSERVIHQPESA